MKDNIITFVTFCVDIGRGELPLNNSIHRNFELYKSGMYENINTKAPMILFSSIQDLLVPHHRNETNFRHFPLTKIIIENDFPNFELYREYYPTTKKDEIENSLYYYTPLVVLKMKKMIEISKLNPFDSEIFLWIDCFFTRGMLNLDFMNDENAYQMMCENVKQKLNNNKFILLTWGPRPFGFFWGGNIQALQNIYEHYFKIFFEFLPTKLMTEELIFKVISERYPELIYLIEVENANDYKLTCKNFMIK